MTTLLILLPWTVVLALLVLSPQPHPALPWIAALSAGGLALGVACRNTSGPFAQLLWIVLALSAGWWLAATANERFAGLQLTSPHYEVSGWIEGLPEQDRFGVKLRVRPACLSAGTEDCLIAQGRHALWPVLLDITVPHRMLPQPPLPGQYWQFLARPAIQQEQDPFSTFDLQRWLKASHVVARLRVANGDSAQLLDDATAPVQMARLALREALKVRLDGQPSGAGLSGLPVVLALVTGDRALMSQEHWRIFNNTGTTHLIAISGAHIMLVTGVVVWLFNLVLKRWTWLTMRVPSVQIALVLGWLVALVYGAIAGLGFPVQRALIMLTLVVLFRVWGRAQPLWIAWNVAFFLVILWDPMAVFSLGFWLSFIAVYWIIWMAGGAVLPVSKARMWTRVQLGIFFGLAPVLLWQLQNLSLVSSATNLFAIPLVGLVLTPLSLLWALVYGLAGNAADMLLFPAQWLAEFTILLLQWCADAPFSVLNTTPHPVWAMLLALLGVVWLCTAGLPARWLAPVLCLPLLLPAELPSGVQVLRGTAAPRIVINQPDRMLLIGKGEWPALLPRWQQNLLRYQGIGMPAEIPVAGAGEHWSAPYWTLSTLSLRRHWLGRDLVSQGFLDLCRKQDAPVGELAWQVVYRNPKGTQCAVLLQWQGSRLLLLSSLTLKAQQSLLDTLKMLPAVHKVLFHPRKQDRFLPALVRFWQQDGVELLLTELPAPAWRDPLDALALQVSVLSESGPRWLEPATE